MAKMEYVFYAISAAVGAFFGLLWGCWDGFARTLVFFMVADYITGVTVAIQFKELSSENGFVGILKKIGIVVAVWVATILDREVIGGGAVLRTATLLFYISNEGISILENLANMGVKLPKKIVEALKQVPGEDNGAWEGEKENGSNSD